MRAVDVREVSLAALEAIAAMRTLNAYGREPDVLGRFTAVTYQVLGHLKTVCVLVVGYSFFGGVTHANIAASEANRGAYLASRTSSEAGSPSLHLDAERADECPRRADRREVVRDRRRAVRATTWRTHSR